MIKNDKVFELRIDEEDELSGIDSISLVDEPAIEVNWMYFNKEKEHEFHIPDGEDEKYIQKLVERAQNEQELFDQGWMVHDVQILGKEGFVSTNPNGPSEEDEKEYNVRYKYILNPKISQSPIINTTRDFCKTLINRNYVWRIEDMEQTRNDFGDSALVWRGGFNCRHVWARIEYKKDVTIVNKASVNKGKVTSGGFPTDMIPDTRVLGMDQPSTVTSKTLDNPSPSTVRNLGLSKEKMEILPSNVNVFGYHTRYFELCPLAQELLQHLITMEMDEDTQGMVRSIARAMDNVFRIEGEVINSESVTQHQYEDALISVDDIKDIMSEVDERIGMEHDVSFMDGHIEKIKEYLKEDMGYDVGGIGGYVDPGVTGKTGNTISKSLTPPTMFESYSDYPDSVKNNAKAVLKYVEENGWGSCGTEVGKIRANQLANGEPISEETIRRMYSYLSRHEVDLDSSKSYESGCGKLMYDSWGGKSALSWSESKIKSIEREKMSKQKFQTDDEQRTVIGPAMIPDLKIFRKDSKGNPYFVVFKSDTIRMIAEKYMRNKYIDNNDLMHDGQAVNDVYVVESWIKESENDKSNLYGYESIPVGSWFIRMKVAKTPTGDKVWEKIKNGVLNGFSVSGYFEEVASFCREEMFLKKVVEILKNIED
jgi:hypothetical protein